MAAKKTKRRRKKKPLRFYLVKVRRFTRGKYRTETVAMSSTKRGALSQFKQAAEGHGGYVSLHEDKIVKERFSTER